jgi:hypothetical protein
MNGASRRNRFNPRQLETVNEAARIAEHEVIAYYKINDSQWLKARYDIKTEKDLRPEEIVDIQLAQVLRFEASPGTSELKSARFDFYKICLQDHCILDFLKANAAMSLFPLILYITTHELVHIVRFSTFKANFAVEGDEREKEEIIVHRETFNVLSTLKNHEEKNRLLPVFDFYRHWRGLNI